MVSARAQVAEEVSTADLAPGVAIALTTIVRVGAVLVTDTTMDQATGTVPALSLERTMSSATPNDQGADRSYGEGDGTGESHSFGAGASPSSYCYMPGIGNGGSDDTADAGWGLGADCGGSGGDGDGAGCDHHMSGDPNTGDGYEGSYACG